MPRKSSADKGQSSTDKGKKPRIEYAYDTRREIDYDARATEINDREQAIQENEAYLAAGNPPDPLYIYDQSRWFTVKAWNLWKELKASSLPVIPERGFDDSWGGLASIKETVEALRLQTLFAHNSEGGNLEAIIEFYAALPSCRDWRLYMRGGRVEIIEVLYDTFHLTRPTACAYKRTLETGIHRNQLGEVLCTPSGRRKIVMGNAGKHVTIPRAALNREAKVWHHVVSSKIMPHMHLSTLDTQRVILIYCIMTKQKIDFPAIILDGMFEALNRKMIWFPNLITTLCAVSGIDMGMPSELTETVKALDTQAVAKMKVDGHTLRTEQQLRRQSSLPANIGGSSSSGASRGSKGRVDKLLHRKMKKLAELLVDSTAKAAHYAKCAWKAAKGRPTAEPQEYQRPDLSFFDRGISDDSDAPDEEESSEESE